MTSTFSIRPFSLRTGKANQKPVDPFHRHSTIFPVALRKMRAFSVEESVHPVVGYFCDLGILPGYRNESRNLRRRHKERHPSDTGSGPPKLHQTRIDFHQPIMHCATEGVPVTTLQHQQSSAVLCDVIDTDPDGTSSPISIPAGPICGMV